ncbi:MAG: ABC transporter substrate-binding protein [Longimicrobiales bacterium]
MKTRWRYVVLTCLSLCAVACADRKTDGNSGAEGSPVQGGTVVLAGNGDMDALNPLVALDKYAQEVNRSMMFIPLVRYDSVLDYAPALARSWKMTGDTGVIFYLRNDVRWHDGKPTTAEDVLFTFERAKDTATAFPNSDYFTNWRGAKVIDSITIQFTWVPHLDPLAGVPFLPVVPKHLLDSIAPAALRQAAFNKHPVGNGPFKFVEYRANDRWEFEANPDYPTGLGGRPYIDRLIWRIIPEAAAQATEIQTGNVDVILTPKSDQIKMFATQPDLSVMVKPSRQFANVGWNGKRPPLNDANVRRALSLAIDRQAIIQTLRSGYGQLAVGPIGPYHWAFDTTLTALPFSPDSARTLLRAAGIYDRNNDGVAELPNGKQFVIEMLHPAGSAINQDMAVMIASNLSQVGVKVVPKATEAATMYGIIGSPDRKFDAVIIGWESDFRINLRDILHTSAMSGGFQMASYSNPRVDALIDSVGRVTDRAAALPIYKELQRILRDDQPWSFLYYFPDLVVTRKRLHGAAMDIRGTLLNVGKWWVTPAAGGAAAQNDSAARTPVQDSAR